MIFSELNGQSIPNWFSVWDGSKTVTTRKLDSTTVKQIQKKMEGKANTPKDTEGHVREKQDSGMSRAANLPSITLAVCPSRGKAAICKNCGGWKEWHGKYAEYCTQPKCFLPDKEHELPEHFEGSVHFGMTQKICDHYEPLRIEVKSIMKRSEWEEKNKDLELRKTDGTIDKCVSLGTMDEEGIKEGFSGWRTFDAVKRKLYGEKDTRRICFSKVE